MSLKISTVDLLRVIDYTEVDSLNLVDLDDHQRYHKLPLLHLRRNEEFCLENTLTPFRLNTLLLLVKAYQKNSFTIGISKIQ